MARLDGLRVLLVEDARDVRDVLKFLLEAEGATVVATANGLEAIELAMQRTFDVLLSDLGLPDVSGDVVIRHVKTHSPGLWTVVATGYGEPYIGRARLAGADAILTKPLTWSVLLNRLVPGAPASNAA
jgi:two-component system CheB/CheR fusion protein